MICYQIHNYSLQSLHIYDIISWRENIVFSRVLMNFVQEKTVKKIKGKIVGPIIHCSPVLTRTLSKDANTKGMKCVCLEIIEIIFLCYQ